MPRHALISPPHERLSLQESTLASAMLHKLGDATIRYTLQGGDRIHTAPRVDREDLSQLTEEFARDPKESLAWVRESLIAISEDNRLSEPEKSSRLDRYLDAYADLTLKLDHEAFPPSESIQVGIPEYIPDGFVDMGGEASTHIGKRSREMIKVDKAAIFDRYKPLLKNMFSRNYEGLSSDQKKRAMFTELNWGVFNEIPYNADHGMKGVINLGEVSEGQCRHIALTFQVLAQAVGLTSRLLKCNSFIEDEEGKLQGGRHAANMVRVNSKWFILDPTNPDYERKNGSFEGKLGIVPIDRPPQKGESRSYEHTMHYSGKRRRYITHNDAYWFIDQEGS